MWINGAGLQVARIKPSQKKPMPRRGIGSVKGILNARGSDLCENFLQNQQCTNYYQKARKSVPSGPAPIGNAEFLFEGLLTGRSLLLWHSDTEFVRQLYLPLHRESRWAEDQDRPIIQQH